MSSSKLAVVGAGKWGINHIKNLYRMNALGAIVEADLGRHESIKRDFKGIPLYQSLDALKKSEVQGVVVATPVNTHYEIAKTLLENNFPVLVEKPTTTKLSTTLELVNLADSKNLTFMTGYLLLYQPAIVKIKELLAQGVVGDLKSLQFTRVNFGRARSFENAFWSLGVHDVAVFSYLCSQKIKEIKSFMQSQRTETQEVEDDVKIVLETTQGVFSHFHASWNAPFKRRELLVTGTRGFLFYDEDKNVLSLHRKNFVPVSLDNQDDGIEIFNFEKVEALELELKDFIASIETKTRPRAGGDITLQVSTILERIFHV